MREQVSAMVDGELDDQELSELLLAMHKSEDAGRAWNEYQLISDALQDTAPLSAGFGARLSARLEAEPTVLAPKRPARSADRTRWMALSAAASFSAVALVGWLAFAPQQDMNPGAPIAQQAVAPAVQVADQAPLPQATNDYLLAHQTYSPRSNLQGIAPYVRTVSETSRPR